MRKFIAVALLAAPATIWTAGGLRADDTGMASSHTLRKEGGKLCMADHAHTGSGTAATKPAAKAAAIRAWADFTNLEYGSDWARFGRAAGAVTRYTKEEKGWTATVDARPCK